ncbi:LCP family protein [Lagierella sp.]|uniref:LCP family protein n=1 Tax=Lagierella sp. TaxID=2849657 RepID=UPI002633F296|nr:LCP family protein [Lagierella sp.]
MKVRSIIIFLVSVLIFGGAYFVFSEFKDLQARSTVEIDGSDIGTNNKIEHKLDDNLFFLLVGVDKNVDVQGEGQDNHVRTDTMMLVNVNFNTGEINTVSIPRDTKVEYDNREVKINAAHAYDGITGALKAVRELTGLDVDYYMSVDYDAVSRIVEAVGGVEVDSPVELNVPEIDLYIPKGKSKLNGQQALYFVRARELLQSGTDLERVQNQQYFLKQLMSAVLKPSNIMNIGNILDVYKKNVKTNIDLGNLGSVALKAINFNKDKLHSYTLEGTTGDEYTPDGVRIAYFYADEKKMNKLFSEIFQEYFINKNDVNKYKYDNESDSNYGEENEENSNYNYDNDSNDSNYYNNNGNNDYNNNYNNDNSNYYDNDNSNYYNNENANY